MYERGALVLVPFPYTDLSATKTRPALVLSGRPHNKAGDIVVCGITSNLANSPASVLIDRNDLVRGKLPKPSRIKVSRLITLHVSVVRKNFGQVKPDVLAQVWKELEVLLRP